MAAVYWLSETGKVEPDSVCTVDYSDEGGAVEFAHQLYRSVHGSACRRPGFTIKNDAGETLYTWRWAGTSAEDVSAEVADLDLPARQARPPSAGSSSAGSSAPRYGHAMVWHGLSRRPAGLVAPIRSGLARVAASGAWLRVKQARPATDTSNAYTLKLTAFLRQASVVWRRVASWERALEPAVSERVLRNGRPAVESLKAHRLG